MLNALDALDRVQWKSIVRSKPCIIALALMWIAQHKSRYDDDDESGIEIFLRGHGGLCEKGDGDLGREVVRAPFFIFYLYTQHYYIEFCCSSSTPLHP